jgi:hypothetical protein
VPCVLYTHTNSFLLPPELLLNASVLYTTSVLSTGTSTVLDSVNTTVGVRALSWDADTGLAVNSQPVKMRGFCNHESFAGVGAALADRIDLFRVQQVCV